MRKRSGPGAANATATLLELNDGATGGVVWDTFGAARTGIASVLQGNTPYLLTLRITRTSSASAQITTTISGGTLVSDNTLTEIDATDIVTGFDTVAIGAAEAVQSGDLTLTRVQLVHEVNSARLINLSVRTDIPAAGESFTLGYVVGGSGTRGSKPLVIRAAGPSLATFGLTDALADPQLELFTGSTANGQNDNWGGSADLAAAMAAVGAFPFAATSRDAAVLASINGGSDSSVRVSANGSGTGTVIAEIYDASPSATFSADTPRLINVSVRKHLGTGLTAGFVVGGFGPKTVLIRAIGPTLGAFGVEGIVADPQLALFGSEGQIAANDNWGGGATLDAAFKQVGAFALAANSRDAPVVTTLAPGNYTVQVSGVGGTSGVALVEVYEVP